MRVVFLLKKILTVLFVIIILGCTTNIYGEEIVEKERIGLSDCGDLTPEWLNNFSEHTNNIIPKYGQHCELEETGSVRIIQFYSKENAENAHEYFSNNYAPTNSLEDYGIKKGITFSNNNSLVIEVLKDEMYLFVFPSSVDFITAVEEAKEVMNS